MTTLDLSGHLIPEIVEGFGARFDALFLSGLGNSNLSSKHPSLRSVYCSYGLFSSLDHGGSVEISRFILPATSESQLACHAYLA